MIPSSRFLPFAVMISAALVAPCVILSAQTVQPSPSAVEDAPIELSPFIVSAEGTVGYVSENSLAGSRLNTNLRDTPAVVDVFTEEFLSDIGATTLEDALAYANNSQEDFGDTERVINGLSQVDTTGGIKFRSRGLQVSSGRNYFESGVPQDLFSIDRIDESRGPNSILFGIGSAGGLVNASSKQANVSGDTSLTTSVRIGSDGLFRSTIDMNLPVVREKLAVRINGLYHDEDDWRDHLYNKKRGVQMGVTARPFQGTNIMLDFEQGDIQGVIGRNWTIRDRVTQWLDQGETLTNATTPAAPTAAQQELGLARLGNISRIVYVDNQGYIYNSINEWTTTSRYQSGNGVFFNDPDMLPYTSSISGPGGTVERDYRVFNGAWQQKLTPDLFFEVAAYHEDGENETYDIGFSDVFLQADPNVYFRTPTEIDPLDGYALPTEGGKVLNPNVGNAYIESAWQQRWREFDRDAVRASLAWHLKAGLFGDHQLATMAQRSWDHTKSSTAREAWLGAPFAAGPTANQNLAWRRHYINWGESESIAASNWADLPTLTYDHPTKGMLTSGWVPTGAGVDTTQTIDTLQFAAQSFFWNRRIATTLGYRIDDLTQDRVESMLDKTGIWVNSNGLPVLDYSNVSTFTFRGNTKTGGVVLHANDWLSFFFNASENLGLPNFSQKLGPDSDLPPPPEGTGRDYGITLTLLQEKAFLRIARFQVKNKNLADAMGVNNFFTPNYNDLIGALDGLYTEAQMAAYSDLRPSSDANADLLNYESSGYEARLNANVTQNLRLIANVSYTESSKSDAYPYTTRLIDQLGQFITDVKQVNPGVDVDALVGTTYDALLSNVTSRAIDFEQDFGNRKIKGSIFANYRFDHGWLDGFSVGLGARYQGPIAAGKDAVTGEQFWGNSYVVYDGMLGYKTKLRLLGKGAERLTLQLNVRNVFDYDDLLILRYQDAATIERFTFATPREISLTATVRF